MNNNSFDNVRQNIQEHREQYNPNDDNISSAPESEIERVQPTDVEDHHPNLQDYAVHPCDLFGPLDCNSISYYPSRFSKLTRINYNYKTLFASRSVITLLMVRIKNV